MQDIGARLDKIFLSRFAMDEFRGAIPQIARGWARWVYVAIWPANGCGWLYDGGLYPRGVPKSRALPTRQGGARTVL